MQSGFEGEERSVRHCSAGFRVRQRQGSRRVTVFLRVGVVGLSRSDADSGSRADVARIRHGVGSSGRGKCFGSDQMRVSFSGDLSAGVLMTEGLRQAVSVTVTCRRHTAWCQTKHEALRRREPLWPATVSPDRMFRLSRRQDSVCPDRAVQRARTRRRRRLGGEAGWSV